MKKLIIFLLCLSGFFVANSQYIPLGSPVGNNIQRVRFIETITIPYGSVPSLNGGTTLPGALYFNTTDTAMYVFDGQVWRKATAVFQDTIVENMQKLATIVGGVPNVKAKVKGFRTPSDGGDGDFYWDYLSTDAPITGMIVQATGFSIGRWKRILGSSDVSVKMTGAYGDSVHIDNVAIQTAEDYVEDSLKGGNLIFPNGDYNDTFPIIIRKNVHWVGKGNGSYLFNSRSTSTLIGDTYCYFMGNFNVPTYGLTLHYNTIDTLKVGSNIVKLTSAETDSFSVGSIIFIESPTGFSGLGGFLRPYYAEINKVIGIDRTNGYLYIKHPMDTTLAVANIGNAAKIESGATSDVLGIPFYIAENCSVDNMKMSSSDYVAKRYGAFECNITHNYFHSTKGVGGNGLSWCNFTDNTFEFSYKAIEYAFYSSDTHIERNRFIYFHGLDDGDIVRPGIKMGENVRNCTVSFNTFLFGDNYITGPVCSFDHAFNNRIVGNKIYSQNVRQNVFDVRATNDDVIVANNLIQDNEVWSDNANSFINLERGTTNAKIYNNMFKDNIFHGIPSAHAYSMGGDRNTIVGGHIDTGDVSIEPNSTNYIISSPSIGGNVPQLMLPYKPAVNPKIRGTLESIDGYYLYYTDSSLVRHQIPYSDTVVVTGDANYSMIRSDRLIQITTSVTAPRNINLVRADLVPAGTRIVIEDFTGSVNATNFINIVHAGSDVINGANNVHISIPYGGVILYSDGVSKWNFHATNFINAVVGTQVSTDNSTIAASTGFVQNARPVSLSLVSNVTNTSTTMNDVAFPSTINVVSGVEYHLHCNINLQCSTTNGDKIGVHITGTTVIQSGYLLANNTTNTDNTLATITVADGSSLGIICTVADTQKAATIDLYFTNSTSGTLTLSIGAQTGGDAATMMAGSTIELSQDQPTQP